MRMFRQHKTILTYAVLAIAVACVVGLTPLQAREQDQYPDQDQDQSNQSYQQQPATSQGQGRDMQLERQIANTLRQQGYGAQGEIMILATGDQVILLGSVPSQNQKDGAEQAAEKIASGRSIDNRLHVASRARRMSDSQLTSSIKDRLPDDLSQNVQVQARNGTATLRGRLDTWDQVADAIDAAFASGASQVNSQFSVGAAGATAQGEAYPSYGYTPGQQGQAGGSRTRPALTTGQQRASTADLRLAQQVASQLRQQLPPGQNVQPVQPQSIYVTVKQGTVTLHGYVQNDNEKQQAQQIVQSLQGVQNVRNNIIILSSQGPAGPSGSQSEWQGQGQSQQQGAGSTSGQGMAGQGSRPSMTAADRRLAQGVQQQLQNQFPDANINVTASQGTVTLQGTVQDNSAKQAAEQAVRSVSGVQDVQNNLRVSSQGGSFQPQGYIPGQQSQTQPGTNDQNQVGQSSSTQSQYGQSSSQSQSGPGSSQMGGRQAAGMSASDMTLARQVVQQLKQQLSNIPNIQVARPDTIYVTAAQGTIRLEGSALDRNIGQQAAQIAGAIPGVRNVANALGISGAGSYPSYGYMPGQEQQTQQGAGDQGTSGRNQGMSSRNQNMQRFIGDSGRTAASQSDMALAQQVAQKLKQQLSGIQNVQVVRPGTIYVIVNKGTVTLEGFVPDNNAKQKAEQIAKSITGIQNVKNSLNIGGAGSNQALGYTPPEEDEFAGQESVNQQRYGNQRRGNQQSENQFGNQGSEDQQSESQTDEGDLGDSQPDDGSY